MGYSYNVANEFVGCSDSYLSNDYIAIVKDLSRIPIDTNSKKTWL